MYTVNIFSNETQNKQSYTLSKHVIICSQSLFVKEQSFWKPEDSKYCMCDIPIRYFLGIVAITKFLHVDYHHANNNKGLSITIPQPLFTCTDIYDKTITGNKRNLLKVTRCSENNVSDLVSITGQGQLNVTRIMLHSDGSHHSIKVYEV